MYGVPFDQHDERYAHVGVAGRVDGVWRSAVFSHHRRFYDIDAAVLEPKPIRQPPPTI
jgi:FMNH2-dependent dimethyl sulfone monooxygenase